MTYRLYYLHLRSVHSPFTENMIYFHGDHIVFLQRSYSISTEIIFSSPQR